MRVLVSLLFIFLVGNTFGVEPVVIDDNTHKVELGYYLEYLEDPTHKLVVGDMLKEETLAKFVPLNMEYPNFGMSPSNFWFHFKVQKNTTQPYFVHVQNYQDSLLVYTGQGDGTYKLMKTGKLIHEKDLVYKTNMFLIPFEVAEGEMVDVFIMANVTDPFVVPIWLVNHQAVIEDGHIMDQGMGIFYGFMLFIVLLNIFLLFSEWKWSYVWYILYVALLPLMMVMGQGYVMEYLSDDNFVISHTFVLFSVIVLAILLFARTFLGTKERTPVWNKIISVVIALLVLTSIIDFIPGLHFVSNVMVFILSIVSIIIAFVVGLVIYLKGYKHARFYVLGWGALMAAALLNTLGTFGAEIINDSIAKNAMYWGIAAEAFFLSLAIIDKINILQKETISIQEEATATLEVKVEERTHELAEKNKEITDSISYAKRIQSAILPPAKLVKEYLNDSFILYLPKDVVAGDFYWMDAVPAKDTILFAAADCTGHGVPGAMVSVVCNNALNRSVREFGLTEPAKILDKTREIVIAEFEKSEEDIKDGMDISLCALNTSTNQLQWAGANNPIWILRKGSEEFEETKPDKQPIGRFDLSTPFTGHSMQLNTGDCLYLFSDGFADQFGGEKGKKYKTRKLKSTLISIAAKPMEEQSTLLNTTFENWRGNLEQVDDVCVIGVRV